MRTIENQFDLILQKLKKNLRQLVFMYIDWPRCSKRAANRKTIAQGITLFGLIKRNGISMSCALDVDA